MAQSNKNTISYILGCYKQAWETHDSTLLEKCFSDDAIYQEKPGNILNGLKEIQGYWETLAQTQRNVKFVVKEIMHCGRVTVVEWVSEFDRVDIGESWELEGVMFLELQAGKIHRLKEYFFVNRKALRDYNPA